MQQQRALTSLLNCLKQPAGSTGQAAAVLARALSSRAASSAKSTAVAKPGAPENAVSVPEKELDRSTISVVPGQAHKGDLRSTSGLGFGDGLRSHAEKWLQAGDRLTPAQKTPMQFIQEAPPLKVHGAVVASFGSDDPALGAPVEYIDLRGSSVDNPAVCKYTGNKFYSDDWMHSH